MAQLLTPLTQLQLTRKMFNPNKNYTKMKRKFLVLSVGLFLLTIANAQNEVKVSDLPRNHQGYPYIDEQGLSSNPEDIMEYKTVAAGTNDTIIYRMNKRKWRHGKKQNEHYKQSFHITTRSMDELAKYITEQKSQGFILKEAYEENGVYYVLFVK